MLSRLSLGRGMRAGAENSHQEGKKVGLRAFE